MLSGAIYEPVSPPHYGHGYIEKPSVNILAYIYRSVFSNLNRGVVLTIHNNVHTGAPILCYSSLFLALYSISCRLVILVVSVSYFVFVVIFFGICSLSALLFM